MADAESPGQTQVAEREEELVTKEEQMGGTEQEAQQDLHCKL